jgi:aspartyl-tRNA(Asn)/glutamyl-tRNA(Gln) amidotransferase subunit B
MRSKEQAHDYRYFPEPDLPPLAIDDAWLARVRAALPELPAARRARFVTALGLPPADAAAVTAERALADRFEAAAAAAAPRTVASWLINVPGAAELPPAALAELCRLVDDGRITATSAKAVLRDALATGRAPAELAAAAGLEVVSDAAALAAACRAVLAASPRQVAQYQGGKAKLFGYFVGEVMKATRGRADPARVTELLRALLAEG